MVSFHHPILRVALALGLVGCSGLQQLAECVVDDEIDVADDEVLDGTDMTAGDARAVVSDYSGTITWVGDAEEPITLSLAKAGPTTALVFEDPERCQPTFQYEVLADVAVGSDARFGEQGAPGSVLVLSEDRGRLSLDVDLSDVSGMRLPDNFDPADFTEAWVELRLEWDGEEIAGGGIWKGVSGEGAEPVSAGCCTVSMSPD